MNDLGYDRYRQEGKKLELFRRKITISKPQEAQRKLEELSVRPWIWLGIPNNCASYVEDVLRAGGASDASLSNCPVLWK